MKTLLKLLLLPGLVGAYSFLVGVADYMSGTAILMGVGYPGLEYRNLDPEYRVYRSTSGCMVSGTEVLTHLPNNVAIVLLTRVFGPMRGTYHGPYPSREQAREALKASRESVGRAALQSVGQPVRDCAALSALYPLIESEPVVRCALFEDSTIVLGFQGLATLFDRETGASYARYRVE